MGCSPEEAVGGMEGFSTGSFELGFEMVVGRKAEQRDSASGDEKRPTKGSQPQRTVGLRTFGGGTREISCTGDEK